MTDTPRPDPQAKKLKIRMIGLKGLPGIHGGVERHVEELAAGLASRGHEVTAYCRAHYTPSKELVRGTRILILPTIHSKHLDATVHSFLSAVHAVFSDADIVHFHGIGPAIFSFIPRLCGKKVVTTVHSRDYLRSKWGPFARWALRTGERIALLSSHRTICVSRELAALFTDAMGVLYIPNGVPDPTPVPPGDFLRGLNLAGNDYLLYAGRVSPEKGTLALLQAFRKIETDLRLVVAGGESHNDDYEKSVEEASKNDPRVLLTGYVDAQKMAELYSNARAFVLSSEHEGLPIALLEAASYACPIVTTDIPAAREVMTDESGKPLAAFAKGCTADDLKSALLNFLGREDETRILAGAARDHVLRHYRWDAVAAQTEETYRECATGLTKAERDLPCPLCGSAEKTLEYDRTRSGSVVRCTRCAMVFSANKPPAEEMPPAVTDDPEAYLENARHRLGILREVIGAGDSSSPVRLLDVGCFDGHFAAAAKTLGFEAAGVEPVAQAAEAARRVHGLDVRVGTFESVAIEPQSFDVVSLIHVFEHLDNPHAALARAREVLRPGGRLLMELPAYDSFARKFFGRKWRQFIADHARFYTNDVLTDLLRSEGFEILREQKVGKVLSWRLLSDRVERYYSRALGRLMAQISSFLGISSRRFQLDFGDIRLIIARRRPD